MPVVIKETNITATTQSQQALPDNAVRAFLEIQNKSGNVVTVKFGSDFVTPVSSQQKISFSSVPTGGKWTVVYAGQETTELAYNANAGAMQSAMQALGNVGANNMTVTGDYTAGFTFTGAGNLANMPLVALVVNENTLTDNTTLSDAVQNLNFSAPPAAGGNFVLSFKGSQTGALASDISAANLLLALNALPTINGGVDAVAQDPISKDFAISMSGAPLAGQAQPLIVVVSSSLTTTQGTSTGVSKLYAVTKPLAGTYKIQCGAYITTPLAYNALADAIEEALEALTNIGEGNVAVAALGVDGNLVAGYSITLQGTLALTTVPIFIPAANGLEATGLDGGDDGDDTPDLCIISIPVTTPAQGPITVTTSVVNDNVGAVAKAVTTTVTQLVTGIAPVSEGVNVLANSSKLYDSSSDVPMDGMWIKATGDSAVVILEG